MKNLKFYMFAISAIIVSMNHVYADESEKLQLNDTHCVVLKFSSDIKYVDFGSSAIIGERLSSDKMLKLQSSKPDFSESTISIVTSDGGYHQFNVVYSQNLEKYVWQQEGESFSTDSIGFSSEKTTHFICGEKITDIVLGSNSVIAAYADKIDNIIKAKAIETDFAETNIHFITETGYIYTFIVKPDSLPDRLSVRLSSDEDEEQSSQAIFRNNSVNDKQMNSFAKKLVGEKPSLNDIGVIRSKMVFAMSGIYAYNDMLAFRFDIQNYGKIEYEMDFLKGYIKDKKETKTTAIQEEELNPVYVYFSKSVSPAILKGGEAESIVMFFSRFTIPPSRILYFEMFEKNGGRHLSFPVSDKELLKAKALY
ncbi:MAG: conjugative transposon protein TraN [Paludibacteraceae bacterium]|nr:conjugative transposon protein TraN [Paludibacteraceae bacterium]